MITFENYFCLYGEKYKHLITNELIENANGLLLRVNRLLSYCTQEGVYPSIDEITGNYVASGWRPPDINERTSNAAKFSTHIFAHGIDIQDNKNTRNFARWCFKNRNTYLTYCGLYMENPQWTPDWVHLQDKPPRSGARVYIPSIKPPLVPPIPEQLL